MPEGGRSRLSAWDDADLEVLPRYRGFSPPLRHLPASRGPDQADPFRMPSRIVVLQPYRVVSVHALPCRSSYPCLTFPPFSGRFGKSPDRLTYVKGSTSSRIKKKNWEFDGVINVKRRDGRPYALVKWSAQPRFKGGAITPWKPTWQPMENVPAKAIDEFFETNPTRRDPRIGRPDVERRGHGHATDWRGEGATIIKTAEWEARERLFDFRQRRTSPWVATSSAGLRVSAWR